MPMFNTPKPRQFHYQPRFYDPEKERWEALKQKYADEHPSPATTDTTEEDSELAYFQDKVRAIDRAEKRQVEKLSWKDLVRKRKMPTFNYTPRFQDTSDTNADNETSADNITPDEVKPKINISSPSHRIKIKRRFENDDNNELKPVSAGKILLYALLAFLLLYWILF